VPFLELNLLLDLEKLVLIRKAIKMHMFSKQF